MTILALILYTISGTFIWFFLGDLAFKVDPKDAIMVFSLLLVNIITRKIVLLSGDKNEPTNL